MEKSTINYLEKVCKLFEFSSTLSEWANKLKTEIEVTGTATVVAERENNFDTIYKPFMDLFAGFGCSDHSSFLKCIEVLRENPLGGNFKDLDLALEKQKEAESSWDELLKLIDLKLGWNVNALNQVNKPILLEPELNPGELVTLQGIIERSKEKLDKLHCQVIILTFGVPEGVALWKRDTKCSYPIYLDRSEAREAFAHFGMNKSLYRARCSDTIHRVMDELQIMAKPHVRYQGIKDDHLQMAGDIVFDSEGKIIYKHVIEDPLDRPLVPNVLKEIEIHYSNVNKLD